MHALGSDEATDIVNLLGPRIQDSAAAWNLVQKALHVADYSEVLSAARKEIESTDMMACVIDDVLTSNGNMRPIDIAEAVATVRFVGY